MKNILQLIPVLFWCLAVLTGIRPLGLGRLKTLLLALVAAVALSKFSFFEIVGGRVLSPKLPPSVIWTFGWMYGAAVAFAVLSTLSCLAEAAMPLFHRRATLRFKRIRSACMAALALAVSTYGIYEGVSVPRVRRVEIAFQSLPREFDGYRIVQLSDLHCSTSIRRGRIASIVEKANSVGADLVAITGDFVDGVDSERRDDLAPLAGLKARDGVVGCSGNHEAYWGWDRWREALSGMGVEFPEATGPKTIRRGAAVMSVGGLADPAIAGTRFAKSAFAGAPDGAFRVLLFHRPLTKAVDSAGARVDLQLSGHTHGGAMPVLRSLVEKVNEGRSRGIYRFGEGGTLYLSSGSGQWAGFPLRLFTPSEITEIVLRRAPGGAS